MPFQQNVAFPVGPLALAIGNDILDHSVNDYDAIAPMFDEIMGIDFHAATHHLRQEVAATVARGSSLACLDLCCGTGLFFDLLAGRFDLVGTGLDRSAGQIGMARNRPARSQCSYAVGDIRQTVFPSGVDLVTINFDALNHLGSRADWRNVIRRAHEALREGGALLLDVNLPDRLLHDWNAPEVIAKPEVVYIQLARPAVLEKEGVRRQTPVIMFKHDGDGRFSRYGMLIEQFAIPLDELCAMISESGFSDIQILQDASPLPMGHIFNKHRAFVSARR